MKVILLISYFTFLIATSTKAQATASYSKSNSLTKVYKSPQNDEGQKKMTSSLKRIVKIVKNDTTTKEKPKKKTSRKKLKAIIDDDIPF